LVRWPGGCFADIYNWKDGIGPRDQRPVRAANRWGSDEVERNQFGTHEFLDWCEDIGAAPWINGNISTGSPGLLAEWAEYCCFRGATSLVQERRNNGRENPWSVPYWGIGNECWDCGGKFTPSGYGDAYATFESSFPRFQELDFRLIACGPDGNRSPERVEWTQGVMQRLGSWRRPRLWGYDCHFYTWGDKEGTGASTSFTPSQWVELLKRGLEAGEMLDEQRALVHAVDPQCRLILGEWGAWHPDQWETLFWQQSTMREAALTAATLHLLHERASFMAAATVAQGINVLHSLVLSRGDQAWMTPSGWVFSMLKSHRGQEAVPLEVLARDVADGVPEVTASLSAGTKEWTLSLANLDPLHAVEVHLDELSLLEWQGEVLSEDDLQAHNTLDRRTDVVPRPWKPSSDSALLPPGGVGVLRSPL
jgi:alpha-N-arabinofuranosidase